MRSFLEKKQFNTYCLPCHGVHQEKLGPMLASITKKRSEDWLIAFIRNSQEVILSGDVYADFLFEQYNYTVMPSFKQLSERKIKDILLYSEKESVSPSEEVILSLEANLPYSNQHIMKGKALFDEQCSSCHFIGKEGEGPSLGSITKRRPWLIAFIKNSQNVIQEGDAYAVHLFNGYNQKIMPPFDFLTQEEIGVILDYINFASAAPPSVAGVNGRKVQQWTSPSLPVYPVSIESITEEQEKGGTFLKILFIVLSAIGALVHIYCSKALFIFNKRFIK